MTQYKLQPNEKLIFDINPTIAPTLLSGDTFVMIGFLAFAVIFGLYFHIGIIEIIFIVLLILLILVPVIIRAVKLTFTSYSLTSLKLIVISRLDAKESFEIPLTSIKKATSKQSITGRFSGIGDIIIKSSEMKKDIKLKHVQKCALRKKQIDQAVDARKSA